MVLTSRQRSKPSTAPHSPGDWRCRPSQWHTLASSSRLASSSTAERLYNPWARSGSRSAWRSRPACCSAGRAVRTPPQDRLRPASTPGLAATRLAGSVSAAVASAAGLFPAAAVSATGTRPGRLTIPARMFCRRVSTCKPASRAAALRLQPVASACSATRPFPVARGDQGSALLDGREGDSRADAFGGPGRPGRRLDGMKKPVSSTGLAARY